MTEKPPNQQEIEAMNEAAYRRETESMNDEQKAAFEAGYNKGFTYGSAYTAFGGKPPFDRCNMLTVPFPSPAGKRWRVYYAGGPEKSDNYCYWSLNDE